MKTAILVTARLGSTRLKQKHLLPVNGQPVMFHLLQRIAYEFKKEIASGDARLIIATSDEAENRAFEQFADAEVFYGPINNIPLRMLKAAQSVAADLVLLAEGDDILCSPRGMRLVYEALQNGASYAATSGLPFGMNSSGFSIRFLEPALSGAEDSVLDTGWTRVFDESAKTVINVTSIPQMESLRFTLDYDEDYQFFKAIIERLGDRIPSISDADLVDFVLKDNLHFINRSRVKEYWENFYRGRAREAGLLLLCGESDLHLESYGQTIVWCPIRRETLFRQKGKLYPLFGDFTPDEGASAVIDQRLVQQLDQGLLQESASSPEMRWAPLAIQQIQWRLSRYLWVKECCRRILDHYSPSSMTITSGDDRDLVHVFKLLCSQRSIDLKVLSQKCDDTGSRTYLAVPYDIPITIDPSWFSRLRALAFSGGSLWYQSYWNILGSFGPNGYQVNFTRLIGILQGVKSRISSKLRLKNDELRDVMVFDEEVPVRKRYQLTPQYWLGFESDELSLIQNRVNTFFNHYTPEFLDTVSRRLDAFFKRKAPRRVVLFHDKVPSSRMLTKVARRHGVPLDFLNHGAPIEKDTPPSSSSEFIPHRYVAWNDSSARAYTSLGYAGARVRHPRNDLQPAAYRPLAMQWSKARILILGSCPVGISTGSREDCFFYDLIESLSALQRLGVPPENIGVKLARTNMWERKRDSENLDRLRRQTGLEFTLVDPAHDTLKITGSFDLVILFPTSGICEAAFLGIPMVNFGRGLGFMAIFENTPLPHAKTREELVSLLESYDNTGVADLYRRLTDSLIAGPTLPEFYKDDLSRASNAVKEDRHERVFEG